MTTVTLPLAALAGLVSFASPCFLPVVPAVLASIVGGEARAGRTRAASLALAFVGGFTVVFVAMWASLGTVGALLGEHRATLRVLAGVVLVALGLQVAGLLRLPLLERQVRALESLPGNETRAPSHRRAFLVGLAFAAGWTPCIGPILGAVVGVAATGDAPIEGLALLLAYSLGLGLPLVLVALGADSVRRRFSGLRRHQHAVSVLTGAAIALTGLALATDLLSRVGGLLPALVV